MEERPPSSQGKMTFHLYLQPAKATQVFSNTYRFPIPTSLPGKGFSSVLQQNEEEPVKKADMVFRKLHPGLDCKEGESSQLQVT